MTYKERVLKAIDLFDSGASLQEISEAVGHSMSWATRVLKENNRSAKERRYPNASWDEEAILKDYQNGMALIELREKYDIGSTTFYRLLKKRGVKTRRNWKDREERQNNYAQVDWDDVIAAYQDYVRIDKIEVKYKVSRTTLYQELRIRGIPKRGAGHNSSGLDSPRWKHGQGHRDSERDPMLTKQVAAICLGHVVPRGWHIHHMSEDLSDNRPENLAVFRNGSDHSNYHRQEEYLQQRDLPIDTNQLVLENDGIVLRRPHPHLTIERERGRLDPQ